MSDQLRYLRNKCRLNYPIILVYATLQVSCAQFYFKFMHKINFTNVIILFCHYNFQLLPAKMLFYYWTLWHFKIAIA